jgi:hypothetical protein
LGAVSQTFPDGAAPGTTATAAQQRNILVEGTPAAVHAGGEQADRHVRHRRAVGLADRQL